MSVHLSRSVYFEARPNNIFLSRWLKEKEERIEMKFLSTPGEPLETPSILKHRLPSHTRPAAFHFQGHRQLLRVSITRLRASAISLSREFGFRGNRATVRILREVLHPFECKQIE